MPFLGLLYSNGIQALAGRIFSSCSLIDPQLDPQLVTAAEAFSAAVFRLPARLYP
jgi:hypothetical protein